MNTNTKSAYVITFGRDSKLYTTFNYPAGEAQVRINPSEIKELSESDQIIVYADLRSGNDLMELALLKDAIDNTIGDRTMFTYPEIILVLPYLPYSRADREFVPGDCFGLMTFSRLLNSMDWTAVYTVDVHSTAAAAYIEGLVDVVPDMLYCKAMVRFCGEHDNLCVLLPDKGAAARYIIPKYFGSNVALHSTEIKAADKVRDPESGKLSGFKVPEIEADNVLIVDDICDGGGTFIGIAKEIRKQRQNIRLGLYVTHGIFSKGCDELFQYFDAIYTSDTFNHRDGRVVVFDAGPSIGREIF